MNHPDPQIDEILAKEKKRQIEEINLIASENIVSTNVLQAMGSILTNKYAEGYPSQRWYNGCEVVDEAESLAQQRACELFGASYANVQPHSGSQANMAAYFALAPVGSTVLAMDLAHGGHLTHGSKANFSGRLYQVVSYGVDRETEQINYDEIAKLAQEHRPQLIIAGASAYSRIIDFKRFREIADSVGAKFMVDMAHIAGLVAAGVHPNPVPFADVVTSTTHKTLRGPRGGLILARQEYAKKLNSQVFPGIQGGPLMHTIAAKAVAFGEALKPSFKTYQSRVVEYAKELSQKLQKDGLRIVSGGTDNHLFMLDVSAKKLTGTQAADHLQEAGIITNKNAIPFDTKKITETSGIRLGSQLVTSRGFGKQEFSQLAQWILQVLDGSDPAKIRQETLELCRRFPLYPLQEAQET